MDNIFNDPKLDDEEFEDTNNTGLVVSNETSGDTTSPYARANLQLPKKTKEKQTWRQAIKGLFKSTTVASGIPGENGARIIHINNEHLNREQKFLHNTVVTGKYSVFSFIFKFLYEEFSKSANIFFLFVSCIQVRPLFFFCVCMCVYTFNLFFFSKSRTFLRLLDGLPLYHLSLYYQLLLLKKWLKIG